MVRKVFLPGMEVPEDPVFFVSWESIDKFLRLQNAIGPDDEIDIEVTDDGFNIHKVPE